MSGNAAEADVPVMKHKTHIEYTVRMQIALVPRPARPWRVRISPLCTQFLTPETAGARGCLDRSHPPQSDLRKAGGTAAHTMHEIASHFHGTEQGCEGGGLIRWQCCPGGGGSRQGRTRVFPKLRFHRADATPRLRAAPRARWLARASPRRRRGPLSLARPMMHLASPAQSDGPPRGACSQDMVHDPKRGWVAKAAATEAVK